jgi:serpin B
VNPDAGPDGGTLADAGTIADAGPGPTPLSCSPGPSADAGLVSAAVAGNNQFAVNLYGQLSAATDGGNLFFSPFSISAALAMMYGGAAGSTSTQMAQVLQFPADPTDLAPAFGALECQLEANAAGPDGGQLDIANTLFGQTGFAFEPSFLSLLQTGYGAPLQSVDFNNQTATDATINAWVSQQTDGMIPNVLQPGDLPSDTVLALANALYFDGLWRSPFDPMSTQNAAFNLSATQTAQVPMMSMSSFQVPLFPYLKGTGFALAELPYQSQVAMDILLPDAVDGLPAVTAQLSQSLQSWLAALTPTDLEVQLPKFNMDSRPTIIPALQALGLTVPFVEGQADFSGIDGQEDIYINAIIHEAVLQVDETGTRAAAVTIVGGGDGAVGPTPTSFIVNRPFLLLLRDIPTGSVLFVGQVTNPAG